MYRRLRSPALALIAGSGLVFAPSAHASLLSEPPRAVSFKLDDPQAPKLSLLRLFYNAEVERRGPLRR